MLWMLIACAGPAGPMGPAGAVGPAGAPGAPGPVDAHVVSVPAGSDPVALYRWVDANDEPVTTGPLLQHVDGDGLVWQIDPETASLEGLQIETLFDDGACAGRPTVLRRAVPPPRVVFTTPDLRHWVREDDVVASESLLVRARQARGEVILECTDSVSLSRRSVVPVDAFESVAPFATGWAAPLHPE